MPEMDSYPRFFGDRPISLAKNDLLRFGPLSRQLAIALCNDSLKDGMVIGIERDWGAGKSTFVNLVIEKIEEPLSVSSPIHIEFSPWLIGNRDDLRRGLFAALQSGILNSKSQKGNKLATLQKSRDAIVKSLRKYSKAIRAFPCYAESIGFPDHMFCDSP